MLKTYKSLVGYIVNSHGPRVFDVPLDTLEVHLEGCSIDSYKSKIVKGRSYNVLPIEDYTDEKGNPRRRTKLVGHSHLRDPYHLNVLAIRPRKVRVEEDDD